MTQNSTAKYMAQAAAAVVLAMVAMVALMMIPQCDDPAWILKLMCSKAAAAAGFYGAYRIGRVLNPGAPTEGRKEGW